MDKRGLADALQAAGIAVAAGVRWADAVRLGLRGGVRRVWAPRGVKIRQTVELRYAWRYVVLAVDGLSGALHWQWTTSMNGAALTAVLAAWKEAGMPGLVWDGAGAHKSKAVRAVGLPTVIQPAAAPQLNPAERVFAAVRRRVEGRRYASLADTMAAVEDFLTELAAAPDRIRALAGWPWIRDTLQPANNTMNS
ncbi:MAG TPA: transposase [Dehalococcoidia bacterium]|nr:transposase [Dehalococcoidia bacterium]